MWMAVAVGVLLLLPLACLGIALKWLGLLDHEAPIDEIVVEVPRRPLVQRVRERILLRRDATPRLK